MAVGGNWKIEGREGIEEVRGRTRKLRREVVGRLDEGSMHENKTAQGHRIRGTLGEAPSHIAM